ncbi:hypothetical protein [Escherichia coli]
MVSARVIRDTCGVVDEANIENPRHIFQRICLTNIPPQTATG